MSTWTELGGITVEEGTRVVATKTITESGRTEMASKSASFPHPNYIHAEPGDTGVVVYVEPNGDEWPTVRFDRTGTATVVGVSEIELASIPSDPPEGSEVLDGPPTTQEKS